MKRSGPTRRTPVRPSTKPPKRYSEPRRGKPPRAKGGKRFPKGYNRAYRDHIASLPCLLFYKEEHVCTGRSEPAHVHADATGVGDIGQLIPLCANAHTMGYKNFHSTGRHSFPRYWGLGTFEDLERLAAEYGGRYTREHDA